MSLIPITTFKHIQFFGYPPFLTHIDMKANKFVPVIALYLNRYKLQVRAQTGGDNLSTDPSDSICYHLIRSYQFEIMLACI